MKDPLLQEYTVEELYYEFRLTVEQQKARDESAEEEADKIEQAKVDDALAWAEAEEAKEGIGGTSEGNISDDDKTWMEQQMQEAKGVYGESFGEDIDEEF